MAMRSSIIIRVDQAERQAWLAAVPEDVPFSRWARRVLTQAAKAAPSPSPAPAVVPSPVEAAEAADANERLKRLLAQAKGQ